jgi:hypothetical protein
MVLCRDPLAIALTAATSARRQLTQPFTCDNISVHIQEGIIMKAILTGAVMAVTLAGCVNDGASPPPSPAIATPTTAKFAAEKQRKAAEDAERERKLQQECKRLYEMMGNPFLSPAQLTAASDAYYSRFCYL